jgi:predicted dithiol-disulfide oxidoreductase (DUF899 family)
MTTATKAPAGSVHFPNESADYRTERDRLLQAERDLRQHTEAVAALRRSLPLGGVVSEDYAFEEGGSDPADTETVKTTRLSQLFAPGKETLLLYSYMYGPAMAMPCTSCTSMLDGLDGTAPHAVQRVNLAVVAKSPIARIRKVAAERGWRHLRLLSSANNRYNADYHGEDAKGDQLPALNVFVRRDGRIHHFYSTELMYGKPEPGQDNRHVDMIWPLWNLFDVTPEGRGSDWYPKLAYDAPATLGRAKK